MKKVTLKSVQWGLARAGSAAAVWTLLFTAALQSKAGGDPSQGSSQTWDCLFSGGGDRGIAYLTFSSDFTISGEELLAPTQGELNQTSSTSGRGGGNTGRGGGDTGRSGSGGSTGSTGTTNEFLFGHSQISGNWSFDSKSNIVGSFVRLAAPIEADVAFTGRVTSGTKPRLTLSATFGQNDHGTYNGVIALTATTSSLRKSIVKFPDPTIAQWTGTKLVDGQSFLEQFTLGSTGTPGIYVLSGTGPDYTTTGECLISSQGKIGFALVETNFPSSTNSNLRSTVGSFSDTATAIKANTTGTQGANVGGILQNLSPVSFKATMLK